MRSMNAEGGAPSGPFSKLRHTCVTDVVADATGRKSLVAIRVSGLAAEISRAAVRDALRRGAAMHCVLEELRACLRSMPSPGLGAGVAIVRFAAEGTWIEVLNAGLPPLFCLRPDGTRMLYPSRSGRIDPGGASRHPSEFIGLKTGSVLLLTTASGEGPSDEVLARLADRMGIGRQESLTSLARRGGVEHLVHIGPANVTGAVLAVEEELGFGAKSA